MHPFTKDEILQYASGRGTPELTAKIEKQIAVDSELRSELEVRRFLLANLNSLPKQEPVSNTTAPSGYRGLRRLLNFHKSVVSLIILLAVTGSGIGGWYFLAEQPLLQDDFHDGWFDWAKWLPPPPYIRESGVREERGHLRLVNRGILIPRREFSEPISITFEWKWIQLGLNPLYADHLSVALRTSGEASQKFAHELNDGVVIRLDAWSGRVNAFVTPKLAVIASTQFIDPPKSFPMPAEEWHKIRITDDGKMIRVYLTGPEVPKEYWERPVLEAESDAVGNGQRFAIFNREKVSGPHESLIRNLVVRRLR